MGWVRNIRCYNRQAKVAARISVALEQAAKATGTKADWDDWTGQFFRIAYAAAPHAFDPSHPFAMNVDMAVLIVLIYPVQADTQNEFPDQIVKVATMALKNQAMEMLGSGSSLREEEKALVREIIEKLRSEESLSPSKAANQERDTHQREIDDSVDSKMPNCKTPDYLRGTGWRR